MIAENGVNFGPGELAVVTLLLGAVAGALVFIFKLLLAQQASALADAKATGENYKSVASDAVRMLEKAVSMVREAEGIAPVKPLAAVLPEHQSPVTEAELITAHQATLRAAVTVAGLVLGVPSRENPPDKVLVDGIKKTNGASAEVPDDLVSKASAVEAVISLPSQAEKKKG